MRMPEEINRIVTDRISKYLFCPTTIANDNLMAEGFGHDACQVAITGDVMFDSVLYYRKKIAGRNKILDQLELGGREF